MEKLLSLSISSSHINNILQQIATSISFRARCHFLALAQAFTALLKLMAFVWLSSSCKPISKSLQQNPLPCGISGSNGLIPINLSVLGSPVERVNLGLLDVQMFNCRHLPRQICKNHWPSHLVSIELEQTARETPKQTTI